MHASESGCPPWAAAPLPTAASLNCPQAGLLDSTAQAELPDCLELTNQGGADRTHPPIWRCIAGDEVGTALMVSLAYERSSMERVRVLDSQPRETCTTMLQVSEVSSRPDRPSPSRRSMTGMIRPSRCSHRGRSMACGAYVSQARFHSSTHANRSQSSKTRRPHLHAASAGHCRCDRRPE